MLVSIIIPLYNCEKWIGKTLESCLEQQPYIKEVIISDNGSTDAGKAIALEWEKRYTKLIKVVDASAVRGANYARNIGFKICTGNYIQWLDGDDQLLPGKLKAQLDAFNHYPNADIVYSDWQLDTYEEKGLLVKKEFVIAGERKDFFESLLKNIWLPPHTYLLKSNIAQKLFHAGYWNEKTTVGQDREYYTHAALLGAKFAYCPGNLVVYNRWSAHSVSQKANSKERILSILTQLLNYRTEIRLNTQIRSKDKINYEKIINTQILECAMLLNARIDLPDGRDVYWKNINGVRTRLRCLVFWLKNK